MARVSKIRSIQDMMMSFTLSSGCLAHSPAYSNRGNFNDARMRPNGDTDYAYEIVSSTYRFGRGVTREIAYDIEYFRSKKPLIVTDPNLSGLAPVKTVVDVLHKHKINFKVYDRVRIEPSEKSIMDVVKFAREGNFDAFVAVGGGSVMDSAKMAAIYSANPDADFWDYVQMPFGKDESPLEPMLPVICVPTTAGTGSESTGIAIFEIEGKGVKNGVRKREILPHLALVDPDHVMLMPENVAVYSGFDVLCHALESYTLIPFSRRTPRPTDPRARPLSQGRNPISDIWAREALKLLSANFRKSIKEPENVDARAQTLLASSIAGLGFGNAGVHLCHGLSYPLSGHVREFQDKDYKTCDHSLIPHGLSVSIPAPAVFEFTGEACPERHLEAAQILRADIANAREPDAGKILADCIRELMVDLKVPNGLSAVGFNQSDIKPMAEGAMNSLSARKLCPREQTLDMIEKIYESSWKAY